jgi:hypothetical protein
MFEEAGIKPGVSKVSSEGGSKYAMKTPGGPVKG